MQLLILTYALFLLIETISSQTCSKTSKCTTKACCSQYGNCGYGPDFCRKGCLWDCNTKSECGKFADKGKTQCPLKVCCSKFGFCGTTKDFCTNGCQSNCKQPTPKKCSSGRNMINIGYFASWTSTRKCNKFDVSNIDPRNYTHLNYAFGVISKGVMVNPTGDDERKLKEFVALREISPNLKLLISVGGWTFNDPGPTRKEFHNIISYDGNRNKFISSVKAYLDKYQLNGIDIDYEYPGADDRGGSPEDTDNYVKFVKEMRSALGSRLITIAAPASYWYLRHFKIGDMSKYLDWINVMTYDIHGVWDKTIKSLGPYVKSHTNITDIKEAINLFLKDGVPADKIVLGLGYYGRGFTLENPKCKAVGCRFSKGSDPGKCTNEAGILAWFEIDDIIASKRISPILDKQSQSKIASWDNQWVAYDDQQTFALKRDYASTNCFKGVMIWSIDMGLDRTSGSDTLPRLGSVTFAQIKFTIYKWKDGNVSLQATSTRDSRYGFDSYSVSYGEYSEHSITKRQNPPNKPCDPAADLITFGIISFCANMILAIWNNVVQNNNGLVLLQLHDPNNPVQRVWSRRIPSGANRVEFHESILTPALLRLGAGTRVDFPNSGTTSTDYMRTHMDAIGTTANPIDERGHLTGNQFSGPPMWYNFVPQHYSVNRNRGANWLVNDWYNTETLMRNFLRDNLGTIRWQVTVHYADLTGGRPTGFTYEAIFNYYSNRTYNVFGYIPNCYPGEGTTAKGKCVGLH